MFRPNVRFTLMPLAALALALGSAPASAQVGGGGQGFGGGGGITITPEGVLEVQRVRSRGGEKADLPAELAVPTGSRVVSLRQLDRCIGAALADGAGIPDEVRFLAGLTGVETVAFDAGRRDVLLVGPAEGWQIDGDGAVLGADSGRPLLRLEDLAVALRCVLDGPGGAECSIDPTRAGLKAVNAFRYEFPQNSRELRQLEADHAEKLGFQTVTTGGVPEDSRFAQVMVRADYLMKRIAVGATGVRGLHSHLDTLAELTAAGEGPFPMARWWFTPAYEPFETNEGRTAFGFRGPALKLRVEQMLVTDDGRSQGSGKSTDQWDRFPTAFTEQFPSLEERYGIFAELHNLFDLTMVAGLVRHEGKADWLRGSVLLDAGRLPGGAYTVPKQAEAAVGSTVVKGAGGRFFAIAFGGVAINPGQVFGDGGAIAAVASPRLDATAAAAVGAALRTTPASAAEPAPAAAPGTAADAFWRNLPAGTP